jgi:hypothetical protein
MTMSKDWKLKIADCHCVYVYVCVWVGVHLNVSANALYLQVEEQSIKRIHGSRRYPQYYCDADKVCGERNAVLCSYTHFKQHVSTFEAVCVWKGDHVGCACVCLRVRVFVSEFYVCVCMCLNLCVRLFLVVHS